VFYSKKDNRLQGIHVCRITKQTSKFANVLQKIENQKGRVFLLLAVQNSTSPLGTTKYTAVFCPLFSVFGPEPCIKTHQRQLFY
jgi:acetyl-CoA synthetase